MSNLTKQNQNYFLITRLMLQFWFERMHEQEIGALIQQTKTLPSGKIEKELSIEFSKWDTPKKEASIILEEYIWGVRCGVMQFVNIDSCSFASVLAVAKTDQMCEIYSPAKVQYYSDGSRRVVPHNVSVYNTDAKFSCYSLIDIKQAENLFPQYLDIFEKLPAETKFLCSPDADKIRIANQEEGEIGFSFNAVDTDIKSVAFYLGNLRATFQYVAREIEAGRGLAFCNPEHQHELEYLNSKICLMSGGNYPYLQAMSLAADNSASEIRKIYIKEGIKGKENFTLLIDGTYVDDDTDINRFAEKDGQNIKICVPPSVYRSWGQPFTAQELEVIHAGRTFQFDKEAANDYYNKINKLRYDKRQINIFARNGQKQKIVEAEELEIIIKRELDKVEKEEREMAEKVHDGRTYLATVQKRMEEARHFAARDTSGPSRSSMYTGFNF